MTGDLGRKSERMEVTTGYEWIWTCTNLLLRSVIFKKRKWEVNLSYIRQNYIVKAIL